MSSPAPNIPLWKRRILAAQKAVSGSDRVPSFKVPDTGKPVKVRILPGWFGGTDARNFFVEVRQHWAPKEGSKYDQGYICTAHQSLAGVELGRPCAFCAERERLREQEVELAESGGSDKLKLETIKAQIKSLNYRQTGLVQLLNREKDDELQLWHSPITAFRQLHGQYVTFATEKEESLEEANDPKAVKFLKTLESDPEDEDANAQAFAYCDAFDASWGYDLNVSKKTADNRTEYSVTMTHTARAAIKDHDRLEEVMRSRHDLEKYVEDQIADDDAMAAACAALMEKVARECQAKAKGRSKIGGSGHNDPDSLNFGDRGKGRRADPDPEDDLPGIGGDGDEGPAAQLVAEDGNADEEYLDMPPPPATPPPARTASSARASARRITFND